jgi:hypothetical protein
MNSTTIYYLSMVSRVIYLCNSKGTIIATYIAFADMVADLKARKITCDNLVIKLQQKTTGITSQNFNLKKEISDIFNISCNVLSVYGYKIGDNTLKNMDMFSFTTLLRSKAEELKGYMSNILALIETNKLALADYGITAAFILKLKAFETSWLTDMHITKNAIDQHKANIDLLDVELTGIQNLFENGMDKLSKIFKKEQHELYLLYKSSRKVPHHHMHNKPPLTPDPTYGTLFLTIINSITGLSLENVNLTILSINYIANTDENGDLTNNTMLPGEYTGKLTKDGYTTINFIFTVTKGSITDLGFMMQPIIEL